MNVEATLYRIATAAVKQKMQGLQSSHILTNTVNIVERQRKVMYN